MKVKMNEMNAEQWAELIPHILSAMPSDMVDKMPIIIEVEQAARTFMEAMFGTRERLCSCDWEIDMGEEDAEDEDEDMEDEEEWDWDDMDEEDDEDEDEDEWDDDEDDDDEDCGHDCRHCGMYDCPDADDKPSFDDDACSCASLLFRHWVED